MNSEPSRVASTPAADRPAACAATSTTTRAAHAPQVEHRCVARAPGASSATLSCSATRPRSNSATLAGTKVSDSSIAAVSASTTVMRHRVEHVALDAGRARRSAGTPRVMMPRPNRLGRITSLVAVAASSMRSAFVSTRPDAACAAPKRRRQFSMMITAPSTMSPKSSAPRLIRLPDTPPRTMPVMREQHRQRDHRRGDQRRAQVAEQQEQHHDDEQRAFDQVLRRRCAMVRSTSVVRS